MKNDKKKPTPKPKNQHVKINSKLIENEEWLTTEQVIEHLNISRSTLSRMRKKKQILFVKIGSSPMYPKSLLNKMLQLRSLRNYNREDPNTI